MKVWIVGAVALIAAMAISGRAAGPQQPDVAALVAAARQAMGGDAALSAASSLTIGGSIAQDLGSVTSSASFESSWIAPDRFLRVSRRTADRGPMGSFEITNYEGFHGDTPIRDTIAPDAPMPVVIPGPAPTTPGEIAAAKARRLDGVRSTFFESLIPLFVTPPGPWGLAVKFAGRGTLDKVAVDAIDITRADGKVYRLLVDAQTHLPLELIWKAKPVVMMSTTSQVSVRTPVRPGGGIGEAIAPLPDPQVPTLPSGDPTAGLPYVEWTMTIRDYKLADGLNWPRRLTSSFGGKQWEDTRIARYRLNPKIDARIFERK